MADQLDSRPSKSAPKARNITAGNGDQLDSAGQAILDLLHTAADEAETDSRQALETAQRLSSQFHAAQERIAELEAEVQQYREKADRAEAPPDESQIGPCRAPRPRVGAPSRPESRRYTPLVDTWMSLRSSASLSACGRFSRLDRKGDLIDGLAFQEC
jgi:hypothetical protein